MNVNMFQMLGVVVRINMQPAKPGSDEKTGVMMIRYGEKRDLRKNKRVQFVNAAKLKIPTKTAHMVEKIKPGDIVSVMGRIQGMSRGNDIENGMVVSSCRVWNPKMLGMEVVPPGAKVIEASDEGDVADDSDIQDEEEDQEEESKA